MGSQFAARLWRVGLFSLFLTLFSACDNFAALMRQATYPPDFRYVSGQELRSNMDQLAFQLQQLDGALGAATDNQDAQQVQVLRILGNMERIGTELRAGDSGSNHPFLEDHMGDFVSNVTQARVAASLSPPRYYMAGRVAGACVNCHQVNR